MKILIKKYVQTCDICMKIKWSKHSFHGKLLSLSIFSRTWSDITKKFITNFLKFTFYKSIHVCDCVIITINRFIKMIHYSFCVKTMNFKQFAYLLIKNVISFHDLSKRIINNKGTVFILHFWSIFSKKLNIDYRLFSSFYSQTNEQIERQN